ncbi:TetR/AcrR family transcriptional regulator [Paenibacillus sp. ACRRX]|uniref:TetR/AcrR family transcriptional regulator n=1 Tax=Paenibacillus sp. UMB4589-SE434 TaxID=3046314 RepID=UPI001EF531AA|nr:MULTISPECIES: TetR/AcrR family transcriptional regulator [unclassified Paenibacillus]MCG7408317.1 TetR/AcrR family transcriptional regulator [Paenibacillus sp. ACRRX]MDK8181297.1 TetR/AcrR family transcriptional regulator [Paenibacillus sp. UMB4589-SE434]
MKSSKIKDIALKFFTIHGYEGASLSQIADNVGIKKQSLYAHFKGKDDLFLQVLQDAKEAELSSKLQYLSKVGTQHPKADLYGYLQLVIDLFQQSEQLKFWLRMSFFPPLHLAAAINEEVIDTETKIQTVIESKFQDWIDAKAIMEDEALIPTLAFSAVVDSIMLELAYGNDEKRLNDKLNASWTVFWRGISKL